MLVKKIRELTAFLAADHTQIRELLHPAKDNIEMNYSLAHASLPAGKSSLPHELSGSEVYILLKGIGRMHINGKEHDLQAGELVYIPPGATQFISNTGSGPLEFLCIVDPPWSTEQERIH